jgi:FAD/FMN-containing dehydrogenase
VQVTSRGVDSMSKVVGMPASGLTCWVSEVDARDFGQKLQENLDNLEWVAAAGVQHQRVVAEINSKCGILPARFATVFSSRRTMEADVASKKKHLLARFEAIRDADEWGVKVFRRASAAPIVSAASGSDYLKKKAEALRRTSGPDEEVLAFAEELAGIAKENASAGRVSSAQRDLQWQGTFLLPRSQKKKWEQAMKKYASRWGEAREIECTGPWPPYSFVG